MTAIQIDITKADSETLEKWLRNNVMSLDQHKHDTVALELCQIHMRQIAAELIKRKGR